MIAAARRPMTSVEKTIFGATLALVVVSALLEMRSHSQLQAQVQSLRQQQTALAQEMRDLKETHQETERQVAPLQDSRAPVHTNASVAATTTPPLRRFDTNTIPSNLVESELERALSESTWGGREAALTHLGKAIAPADIPRALAFLVQRPGLSGLETPLFDELASQWGGGDPNAAIAWAVGLGDTNAQQRALTKVLLGWSKQHREEAARFAVNLPPSNLQEAAVDQVIGDWSFWDAPGAAKWISQNPQFAEKTLGGLIFWGQGSCPAAIADLLDQQYSLGHTNWLEQQGEQVASIWLSRDKPAARAWIERAPLPEDAKQRLLNHDH
jgi:hypothetical protein